MSDRYVSISDRRTMSRDETLVSIMKSPSVGKTENLPSIVLSTPTHERPSLFEIEFDHSLAEFDERARARLLATVREIDAKLRPLADQVATTYDMAVSHGNAHDVSAATVVCMQMNAIRAAVDQWQKDMIAADKAAARGAGQ